MKLEGILESLAPSQPLPTVLGFILVLLGCLLLAKRRYIPSYQAQPAILPC